MRAALFTFVALSTTVFAQSPQFTWEGEVDGTVVISVRGNRVEVQVQQGQPVTRERYRFFAPLPDSRQDVRLSVRESRGGVRITQQPRLDNDYTLAITIQDLQDGASFYKLDAYWEADRGGFPEEQRKPKWRKNPGTSGGAGSYLK